MKKSEKVKKGKYSIPVILDDVKKLRDFQMARCTYFNIECDTPSPGWSLGLADYNIPFYLLGLTGVIWKPVGEKVLFDSNGSIDELFDMIEENPSLYVDTNEIWLPISLFEPAALERGNVFRVNDDLFTKAYSFFTGHISKEEFLKSCVGYEERSDNSVRDVWHSEAETKSFKDWEKRHIEIAIKNYPKNAKSELTWKP